MKTHRVSIAHLEKRASLFPVFIESYLRLFLNIFVLSYILEEGEGGLSKTYLFLDVYISNNHSARHAEKQFNFRTHDLCLQEQEKETCFLDLNIFECISMKLETEKAEKAFCKI